MGQLSTLDPATIKAFETYLGLQPDGVWDPDLEKKVGQYQTMMGQTPGQTDNHEQWSALVSQLQARGSAFGNAPDSVPAQDPAFQAFIRNAGAKESELLDEIQYRTVQTTREINRRAAGFALDKENAQTATTNDFNDRGFGAGTASRDRKLGEISTNIANDQNQYEAGQRDSLTNSVKGLQGDINSLYRSRVNEELDARERIGKKAAQQTFDYKG